MKDMLKKVFKHWEMFLVIFLILEFVVFGAANPKSVSYTHLSLRGYIDFNWTATGLRKDDVRLRFAP